jgi:hypothetical protein
MRSKRQQTMAKLTRERTVKERRALKNEKKQAAKAARLAEADGTASPPVVDEEGQPADGSLSEHPSST